MTADDAKSRMTERLEFFFSDANLRMDKFLRNIVLDEGSEGFVEIDTLLKFNTIKNISTDAAVVAEAAALVESPKLKLNEAKTAIARVEKFTSDMLKDNIKVSLRVGNFPTVEKDDGSHYVNTREEVAELFGQFGKVALVRLLTSFNRAERKKFAVGKGFVEFASLEGMEKAVAELCVSSDDADAKPKQTLKLGESELTVKTMQAWLDKKAAQRGDESMNGSGSSPDKKRKSKEGDTNAVKVEEINFTLDWKKGCVIDMKGLPDGCDREKILEGVKSFMGDGVEARADYSRGDKDGKIRFNEPSDKIAEFATKLNDGSATIGDAKVESASVLEGEAEETYYKEYIAFRTKQMRDKAEDKNKRNKRRRKW